MKEMRQKSELSFRKEIVNIQAAQIVGGPKRFGRLRHPGHVQFCYPTSESTECII